MSGCTQSLLLDSQHMTRPHIVKECALSGVLSHLRFSKVTQRWKNCRAARQIYAHNVLNMHRRRAYWLVVILERCWLKATLYCKLDQSGTSTSISTNTIAQLGTHQYSLQFTLSKSKSQRNSLQASTRAFFKLSHCNHTMWQLSAKITVWPRR